MKVYAVKEYVPYESAYVLSLYSDLDLAKSAINVLIENSDDDYIKREGELYEFFNKYGHVFYIEIYEVTMRIEEE